MANDMTPAERRAAELAHLSAMFFRKCLDEQLPPFLAIDLGKTYLQTLMLGDNSKPKEEPWERPE